MTDVLRLGMARSPRETIPDLLEGDLSALREERDLIERHDWPALRRFTAQRYAVKLWQRANWHRLDVTDLSVEQEEIVFRHYRSRIRPETGWAA